MIIDLKGYDKTTIDHIIRILEAEKILADTKCKFRAESCDYYEYCILNEVEEYIRNNTHSIYTELIHTGNDIDIETLNKGLNIQKYNITRTYVNYSKCHHIDIKEIKDIIMEYAMNIVAFQNYYKDK